MLSRAQFSFWNSIASLYSSNSPLHRNQVALACDNHFTHLFLVVNCPEVTGPPTITTVTRAWSCSTTWAQRCSEGIRLKDQERHAESNTNRVLYTLLCMTDTLVQLQNSNSKRFEVSSSKLATHMEETSVPVSKISAYFRCLVLGERFQPGPCQSGISAKWCKM
jgi:hypothetical protein